MATIRCRRCGKLLRYRVPQDLPYFPFCSERCRLIDLDKWFTEEHRIAEPIVPEPDEDEQEEKGQE